MPIIMEFNSKCQGALKQEWASNQDMDSHLNSNSNWNFRNSYNRFKWENKMVDKLSPVISWCRECPKTVSWLANQEPILPHIPEEPLKNQVNQQVQIIATTKCKVNLQWTVINNFYNHRKIRTHSRICKFRVIILNKEVV